MEFIQFSDSQPGPSTVSTAPDTQLLIDRLVRNRANYHFNEHNMDFDYPIDLTHTSTILYPYHPISTEDINQGTNSHFTHTSTTLYPYQTINPEDVESDPDRSYNPSQPLPRVPPWAPTPYRPLVPTLSGLRPNASPLSRNEKADLIQTRKADAYLKLYKHGELSFRAGPTGCWELQCPAGCWIKTSISIRTPLDSPGHFYTLESHAHGQNCAANSKKLTLVQSDTCNPTLLIGNPSVHLSSCPGLSIISLWPEVSGIPAMARFPWLRTRDGPDKLPFDIELFNGVLYARALNCNGEPELGTASCAACKLLLPKAQTIAQNSGEFNAHTRYNLLNPIQLLEVIKKLAKQYNDLKLQHLNYERKLRHLTSTLSDHSSLIMALSQCDVPYLRQLLHTALKNGAGIRSILRTLEGALEQGYRPRGHSQESLDLALLIYRLGGHNLLYALTQRFPIPSLRTLRNRFSFVKITPTIGRITSSSIQQNIQTLLIASRKPDSPKRGASLLIDETALEETAVYIPDATAVGGLCWLHAHNVDCTLRTYQSALNIVNALKDGRVHLAKEVTVIAIRLFGEDEIYPIVAAPTCKHEIASDMEYVLKTVIDTYSASGAKSQVGPLWSVATDGDATRRKAGHRLFVDVPIPISDPLFGILSNLPGLNMKTGPGLITLDPDFKHNLKRFSTAIRSRSGIYVNGQSINTFLLERYLVWIDGLDESAVQRLLHPDDPQDVPRAVELLAAVKNLGEIDLGQYAITPSGYHLHAGIVSDFDALSLLGHILRSFIEPYINISLSLSEQIISLSRLAHLLFACYCDQRRRFIPNQLYYDVQSMIKTAVFNVAKQQKLNPEAVFAIVELGDDSLELLFAFLRMCGAHNSAFNYCQVLDRLGSAQDINSIHARNPDLHHGHRRLNLKRSESVDHITRSNWAGDIVSGHCDLPSCWRQGREEAVSILERSKIPSASYDFQTLFCQGSDIDLLSVFGGGKYPSIEDTEEEEDHMELPPPAQVIIPGMNTPLESVSVDARTELQAITEDGDEPALSFEDAVSEEVRDPPADHAEENLLDDIPSRPPSGPGIHTPDYIWCEKRWIHKQSVCRIIISPNFTPKSFDRLMRVRGYTHIHKAATLPDPDNILHGDKVLVGDLFVTLVRTQDKQLALALLRTTAINENGAPRRSVASATLSSPRGNVKLSGDVMALMPSRSPADDPAWVWNGCFITLPSNGPELGGSSRIASIIVPGHLTEIVNPQVADATVHLDSNDRQQVNSNNTTWLLSNAALELIILSLWKKISDLKIALSAIPGLSGMSSSFPYQNGNHGPLICLEGTEELAATRGKAPAGNCPVCGATKVVDLRSHMGIHILRAARDVLEPEGVIQPIAGTMPCGFCGRTGEPECALKVKHMSRGTQWDSKCPRKEKFQYASAEKGSETRPCRNVPMSCTLCVHSGRPTDDRVGIWRYNMEAHLEYQHPEYSRPGKDSGEPLPRSVFNLIHITEREEKWAGVPPRTPFTNIKEGEAEKENAGTGARTRKRKNDAETFGAAARMGKRARTIN